MRTRGVFTLAVSDVVSEFLGTDEADHWSKTEVRLAPYLLHTVLDHGRIDPAKISSLERAILSRWRNRGWLEGGAADVVIIQKQLWNALCAVLWTCYAKPDMEAPEVDTARYPDPIEARDSFPKEDEPS